MRLPLPYPKLAVAHSPTPSSVRIAASSKGEGKKALAACDSWCSVKTIACGTRRSSPLLDLARQVQLLLQPQRHRLEERAEAARARRRGRSPAGARTSGSGLS